MDARHDQAHERTKKKKTPHVLVLAHYATGHLPPAFYFSMEVARQGILVTFVSLQNETSQLISKHESELRSLESLHFLLLPKPQRTTADVNPGERFEGDLMQKLFDDLKIREKLDSGDEPPTCIVATMFVWWCHELALDLQIPRYTLLGSGAVFARSSQAGKELFSRHGGKLRVRDDDHTLEYFDGKIDIAGMPSLTFHDLSPIMIKRPLEYLESANKIIWDAQGVLINTFYDLEADAMNALRKCTSIEGQKFYAIGPLAAAPALSSDPGVVADESKDSEGEEECIRWLNSQPTSSVVYVCFGSQAEISRGQIKELALGLESSKHRFLWILPTSVDDFLPLGFEARVAEVGYVVRGWAPQKRVLSHPSTGAFLTHCGWNSCLEAVSRAVPMIAFPLAAEQRFNCRHLVDTVRVAAGIRRGPDDIPAPHEVERSIRQVMEDEEGRAMRGRVRALQAAAAAALQPGGSTVQQRHEFCKDIKTF